MKHILVFMFLLFLLPALPVEIPIPSYLCPVSLFSSASGGEFVVGTHQTVFSHEESGYRYYNDTWTWEKTAYGEFNAPTGEKVFEIISMDYPDYLPWIDFLLWDSQDRPHFVKSYYGFYHFTGFEEYVGDIYIWPEPEFVIYRSYFNWDYVVYSHSEITETKYHFTRNGDYVVVKNYSSSTTYIYPVPHSYFYCNFSVFNNKGFSKTYEDISPGRIIPRMNQSTGICHYLRLANDGIYRYSFGNTIEADLLYQSPVSVDYMDFQPDPSDRLHIIWKEDDGALNYGLLEEELFSSQSLTSGEFDYDFRLVANKRGDMFLFNKEPDGNLYIMTRYQDSDTWDILTLSLSMGILDGYINEEGGVSLLYYETGYPVIHFCHSSKRGDPLIYSTYTLESGSPQMHAFCQDGNFGILFSKSVGNNYIFVNEPSYGPCSIPGSKWIMYE